MKNKNILSNIFACIAIFIFMACSVAAAQSAVNLGTAGDFVVLAKSGISTTGTTAITGNIGVSPAAATFITGFGLIMDPSNEFSTSSLITGKIYAADYTPPTPTAMTTAVSDMETAYTDAAGRTLPDYTELGAGNIGGMTLAPGLYKWGTDLIIPTDVTLDCKGDSNAVYIFQIAQNLDISNGKQVILTGGCQAPNIFWQVAGQATLGTTSVFNGNILSQTAVVLNTGATLNGRALAQTAVTLDSSNVELLGVMTRETTNPPSNNGEVKTNDQQPSSNKGGTTLIAQKDSADKGASVEKNQTNQGIGQELSQKIEAKKEEIKSGDYEGSLGQSLNVKELTENLKELRVNGVTAQTKLNITAETDSEGRTNFTTKLRNGQKKEIKIMPDTASKKALESLKIKVCSSENNCTIQLKDVGNGKTEKIQYEVQIERHSKILGIFQKKMHVGADVDAETGETKVNKPWWAFIATEQAE